MNKKHTIWLYLFILFSFFNILAEAAQNTVFIFVTKPLLMIFLSGWFYLNTKEKQTSFTKGILLGFIFSFFGDTFLMFSENGVEGKWYFLLGLGSFLITHICYLWTFQKYKSEEKGFVFENKWLFIPFIIFLFGNIIFLWDGIPADLKIPVFVYSSAITGMTLFALNLKSKIIFSHFRLLLLGVLLFLISDTFIGINKFKMEVPYARILIMLFYLMGQIFIAYSAVLVNNLGQKETPIRR